MQKATRQFTKVHNIQLILKTVFQEVSISRAALARSTALTRTTVSEIVNNLIQEGLIQEVGLGESLGGKPPVLLSVNPNARLMMCLDLSQRGFAGALVNLRGEIIYHVPAGGKPLTAEAAYQRVLSILDELRAQTDLPLLGIGIGTPGLVDVDQGIIRQSMRLGWRDLPLKANLEQRYQIPVHLTNDGHSTAMAEYTFGGWADVPNLVVIKTSEGIGSGIVLDGKIHFGDGFIAGEIGHLKVAENNIRCDCGQIGCLETEAGSIVLRRRARVLAVEDHSWLPKGTLPQNITLEDIRLAYLAGHPAVIDLVNQSARAIGAALSSIIGVLDIRQVVLAGDMVGFGEKFLRVIHQQANQRFLFDMTANTALALSTLGDNHVLLGATALVLRRELGLP